MAWICLGSKWRLNYWGLQPFMKLAKVNTFEGFHFDSSIVKQQPRSSRFMDWHQPHDERVVGRSGVFGMMTITGHYCVRKGLSERSSHFRCGHSASINVITSTNNLGSPSEEQTSNNLLWETPGSSSWWFSNTSWAYLNEISFEFEGRGKSIDCLHAIPWYSCLHWWCCIN